VAGLASGHRGRAEALRDAGATHVLDSIAELPELVAAPA
jgi:phosphoglycolate phosphatase-like HAD superfamily hydrolase